MDAVSYHLATPMSIYRPGLACDLDETASDTVSRWMEILSEELGNPEGLSPRQLVEKYSYTFNVPYWIERPDFFPTISPYQHDNEFHRTLPLSPGAAEALSLIDQLVGISCYATTRPISVEIGTRDWIIANALPRREMLMRPLTLDFNDADRIKVETIVRLYPSVTGLIDDKPDVVRLFPTDYRGTIYHLGARAALRNDIAVVACPTWQDVAREVVRGRERNRDMQP